MEKLFEKKNFGLPVTLLSLLAYLIGYSITNNYEGLLVAVVFAAIVFIFDFDDRVKLAVKQSFLVAILFNLIYLVLSIISQLSNMTPNSGYVVSGVYSLVYKAFLYLSSIFNIVVVVVYVLFIMFVLIKKDIKLDFILNILGEGKPKPQPVPTVYQPVQPMTQPVPPMSHPGQQIPQPVQPMSQPVPPMPQQVPPMPQPAYIQQPIPTPVQPIILPAQPKNEIICPNCQAVNRRGDLFCTSCGTKL